MPGNGPPETTKNDEDLSPARESRELFSKVLTLAKELLEAKILTLHVDADGDANLVVDLQGLEETPDEKFRPQLSRKFFVTLMRTEFSSLVNAATQEEAEIGIRAEFPREVVKDVGLEELEWRLTQAKEELIPPDLQERVKLRRTASAAVLDEMTWQIGLKKHDEVEGDLEGIPFATLSIRYCDPQSAKESLILKSEEVSFGITLRSSPRQLALELHEADVAELVDKLTVMRDNLAKLRSKR